MTELRLILGDQLNPHHSWFDACNPNVIYVMLELRAETAYVLHHAQKVIAIFAAMRAFATALKEKGHRGRYVRLSDDSNRGALEDNLNALVAHYGADRVIWQEPDEWRLDTQLQAWAKAASVETACVSSEHFFTTREQVSAFFATRKSWRMEYFYREMRRQHGVLLTSEGEPEGGKWNYDAENRKRWSGEPPAPEDSRPRHDYSALWAEIQRCGVKTFGEPQAGNFRWPLNRSEAKARLDEFIAHVLPQFGAWQDAMHAEEPFLFHSLISFALNTKMLNPREVVAAAQQAWRSGHAPLPAVEGFIRQILGWREYVRGIYWSQMPGYRELNALDQHAPLPDWFWTGKTQMRCLAHAVGQSLTEAYAHHIQRLMVIGNFSLLSGLSPQAVHEWYLGVYIDAFEWVELPNTLGMSQFGDGGLLASKPYVSSASYIHKMSNYCQGCRYQHTQRTGELACPFNALYWDFFARNQARLGNNPRLGIVFKQLADMKEEERQALADRAGYIRLHLNDL